MEVREVSVLTGQTSDVAQGRYHDHSNGARLKKKDSDLDLKVKAGGDAEGSGGEVRAMIEMTEMTSSKADDDEEEEEDLKGTYMLLCQNYTCKREQPSLILEVSISGVVVGGRGESQRYPQKICRYVPCIMCTTLVSWREI